MKVLIRQQGLFFASQETALDKRGQPLAWHFDLRPLLMNTEFLNLIAKVFWSHYQKYYKKVQVVGLELTTLPLIGALVARARDFGVQCNGAFIRKSRKKYGRQLIIEGELNDAPILAIDDVLSSGSCFEKMAIALEAEGHKMDGFFSILNFQDPRARDLLKRQDIRPTACFTLADFDLNLAPPKTSQLSRFQMIFTHGAEAGLYKATDLMPHSNPVLDETEERIFYGTASGVFYCVNAATGERMWSFKTHDISGKGIASWPALHRDQVLFGSYDGNLYALNQQSGKMEWRIEAADYIGSSPTIAEDLNLVYIGLEHARPQKKGSLAAYDLDSRELRWDVEFDCLLHGSPVYCQKLALVGLGTNDSTFIAADAKTGKVQWEYAVGGPVKHRALVLNDEIFVFGCFDGCLYGLQAQTGQLLFRLQTDNAIFSVPLAVDNQIWIGSADRAIYVFDAIERRLIGKIETRGRIFSSPALIDGHVFIGSNFGRIVEYDPKTLEELGSVQLPDRILTQVVHSDKHQLFYVGTSDGRLIAFQKEKAL